MKPPLPPPVHPVVFRFLTMPEENPWTPEQRLALDRLAGKASAAFGQHPKLLEDPLGLLVGPETKHP